MKQELILRKRLALALGVLGAFFASQGMAQRACPKFHNVRYQDDYSAFEKGDCLMGVIKQIPLGGAAHVSFGGQYRARFEFDKNRAFGASDPKSQDYVLNRVFLFSDLRLGERGKIFAEFKAAGVNNNDLPPSPIMRDKLDIQNLFAEYWLLNRKKARFGVRLGRQEMQFGKQRLISPLDWANTRRTFEGARVLFSRSKWEFDAFLMRHVPVKAEALNKADSTTRFSGFYIQRKWRLGKASAYFLSLDNNTTVAPSGSATGFSRQTVGAAWDGASKNIDWSTETALQFGDFAGEDIGAWMLTLNAGYTFKRHAMKPRLGLGLDLASGDADPNDAKLQSFNQLFPLAHAYFGWTDQVGRSNLRALQFNFRANPHERVTVKLFIHDFHLLQARDAFYNAAGAAARSDIEGLSGKDVGQEVDVEISYNINQHIGLAIGAAVFVPGEFIKKTGDSEAHRLIYFMIPVKF